MYVTRSFGNINGTSVKNKIMESGKINVIENIVSFVHAKTFFY